MGNLFSTAIIDPPWPYGKASAHEKLSGYVSQEGNEKYQTLTIADMAALSVGSIVSDYLFMWVVGPFVREALELLDAWGFVYRSQMCWHKTTGFGVGFWVRGDHELVFVASKKGSKAIRTNVSGVFETKRTRHSEKPPNVHELIEKCFPGPYLEIFGRRERLGWTVVGNQAPGDGQDIRVSLQNLMQTD